MRTRFIVVGLRLGAVVLMIVAVSSLWNLMSRLPWQADCAIAAAAVLTFAYKFEREAGR